MAAVETHRDSWRRYVGWTLLVLVITAIGIGGWMLYAGISVSLQAEVNLHAMQFPICLVDQFVYEKGRWPQSWQELERMPFPSKKPSPMQLRLGAHDTAPFDWGDWPSSSKKVQEHVAIDFNADMSMIAHQDPSMFIAIKSIGPCFVCWDYFEPLQETLKKTIGAKSP
jgi:hypothetical protein